MSYEGFLSFGGTEIVNVARTAAYVNTLMPTFGLENCHECADLQHALGDEPYTSPFVDHPDWFDEDDANSWGFYGVYPLEITGLDDAVRESAVTQLAIDGAVMSAPRQRGREIRVSALLIGADAAAVQYGITWLRYATLGSACRDSTSCTGDHLCYFSACPPICTDSPDAHPVVPVRTCEDGLVTSVEAACALPYERNLYQVTVIDGPRVVQEFDPVCGAMVRVEFTMVAGVPWSYASARFVAESSTNDPSLIVPEISCAAGSTSTLRMNLATNPVPLGAGGWTSADTDAFTATRDTTVTRLPGRASVRVDLVDAEATLDNLATNPLPTTNLNGWSYRLGEGAPITPRTNYSRNPAAVGTSTSGGVAGFAGYAAGTGEAGATMTTTTPSNVVVRTNYALVPRAVANARWGYAFGADETGTTTYVTAASDGPTIPSGGTINQYARRTITTPKTSGNNGFYYRSVAGDGFTVAAGQAWRAGLWVRSSVAVTLTLAINTRTGTTANGSVNAVTRNLQAGVWAYMAGVDPASGAAGDGFQAWARLGADAVLPAGATLDVTGAIGETSTAHGNSDYFDGAMASYLWLADVQYVHAWTGAANATASTQSVTISTPRFGPGGGPSTYARRVITVAKTGGSTGWQATGSGYRATALAGVAGDQVTASVWLRYSPPPASPTVAPLRVRMRTQTYNAGGTSVGYTDSDFFTLTPYAWVRVASTHTATAAFASVGWWGYFIGAEDPDQVPVVGSVLDSTGVLVEDAGAVRDWFYGATPDTSTVDYAWTGTANNSPSTMAAKDPAVTSTLNTGTGPDGDPGFMRNTVVVPKTSGFSGPAYTQAVTPAPIGTTPYTAAVWGRGSRDGQVTLTLQALAADGTVLAAATAPVQDVPADTWTRSIPITVQAPADTRFIRVWGRADPDVIFPVGATIDMARVVLVQGVALTSPVLAHLRFAGQHNTATSTIKVTAGVTYTASLYVATSRPAQARLTATFYSSGGAIVSRLTSPWGRVDGPWVPTPARAWSRIEYTTPAPTGAVSVVYDVETSLESGAAVDGDQSWFTDMLVEATRTAMGYFDGTFTDTGSLAYGWSGTAHASTSVLTRTLALDPGPVVDPDCAVVPSAPRPPVLEIACLDLPASWRRYTALIPAEDVPLWRDSVPVVRVTTSTTAARQVRVRFYPNPFGNPVETLDPCDFCGEFVISYIPPNSTMTIDGIRQNAFVAGPGGAVQGASHLLYASDGGPMTWPLLSCGISYTVVLDVSPTGVEGVVAQLCTAARE